MNNYILAFNLFVLIGCATDSDIYLKNSSGKTAPIYLLQCGNKKCENIHYDGKKIKEGQLALKKSHHPASSEVLISSFSGEKFDKIDEKAKLIANESVTLKTPLVSEEVLLSLALSAGIQEKKPLSFYLLDKLVFSKNKKIRSAAYNAYGVLVYQENRLMEAVGYWKKSLEEEPDNWAAMLNYAIVSLQYGRLKVLHDMEKKPIHEWAAALLSSMNKVEIGRISEAETICGELTHKKNNVMIEYNCGVILSRNPANKSVAKKLLLAVKKNVQVPDSKRKIASDILSKL